MNVSVIIPCYNAGRWIRETLQSVANQTFSPHEIIVIDDGSTDDSVQQIRDSGVDVKLLQTDHVNAAAARNAGIKAATGDWIAFQDAHDLWFPEHLELATGLLQGGRDIAYAANALQLYPDGSMKPQPYPTPFTEVATGLTHMDFIENYGQGYFIANQTKLILRERLLEVGLHDVELPRRHDIDLWLRVLHNHTWSFNPKATVASRVPAAGDISGDVPMTSYFNLRVLLKNRALYPGPMMERWIENSAKRAVSSAFVDTADRDHQQRALALARPWLTRSQRFFCTFASRYPMLLRAAIRLRRLCQPAFRTRQQIGPAYSVVRSVR